MQSEAAAPLDVVGAVIHNAAGEVLCALRGPGMSMPGVWEFPGGKLAAGEAPEEALVREIREELACVIRVEALLVDHLHPAAPRPIRLRTYGAVLVSGQPTPLEHAELRWVAAAELHRLDWAPADGPTVAWLQGAIPASH
ncbi:MAG: (deoxy)nucleoside triphosphate pyrophosphohydrolase [Candidatus Sericytochromatia bacterium]|nr:(deoxy)nucleoside triphosphate pyrophosphohydrolase [Candidatus Sericytochromatia bacterium]